MLNISSSFLKKTYLFAHYICLVRTILMTIQGVVGWCEGVVYLASPGRPADIDLQLGKACYPSSR